MTRFIINQTHCICIGYRQCRLLQFIPLEKFNANCNTNEDRFIHNSWLNRSTILIEYRESFWKANTVKWVPWIYGYKTSFIYIKLLMFLPVVFFYVKFDLHKSIWKLRCDKKWSIVSKFSLRYSHVRGTTWKQASLTSSCNAYQTSPTCSDTDLKCIKWTTILYAK